MNSLMESTAMREAISPAAWPPMPSATRKSFASSSTRNVSSLCWRCRPTSVRPYAFTSIPTQREIDRSAGGAGGRGDLRIVLFSPGGIGEHVDRLRERLELPLGVGFVGTGVAVGMLLPRELPEPLANLRLGGGAIDSEHFVVIDLHSGFVASLQVHLPGQTADRIAHALVVFQALQVAQG